MAAQTWQTKGWTDTPTPFLARVQRDQAGAAVDLKQADCASITWTATGNRGGGGSGTLVISSTIYDTIQTGTTWTYDAEGFNFRAVLPATAFGTPGRYHVVFEVALTDGTSFPAAVFTHTATDPATGAQ